MNKIIIREKVQQQQQNTQTFAVSLKQTAMILPILRSQYFNQITILLQNSINLKQLKFMMSISRLLKSDGELKIFYGLNQTKQIVLKLANNLGFIEIDSNNKQKDCIKFLKKSIEKKQMMERQNKLAIGFHNLAKDKEQEQEDEDQLMKNENLQIKKPIRVQNCANKPRACANCSCGRKDNQKINLSKQELVESVNNGVPVSGCGKCYLGDSFRCGSCPYQGLPAFKPGDKLKLADQGNVIIQGSKLPIEQSIKIQNNGKVSLCL